MARTPRPPLGTLAVGVLPRRRPWASPPAQTSLIDDWHEQIHFAACPDGSAHQALTRPAAPGERCQAVLAFRGERIRSGPERQLRTTLPSAPIRRLVRGRNVAALRLGNPEFEGAAHFRVTAPDRPPARTLSDACPDPLPLACTSPRIRALPPLRLHAGRALAMVLVILAPLGGSLLVPVASRLEARDRNATLERLHDIQLALTGFAIIHGRLPCPSTETDPASPGCGLGGRPALQPRARGRAAWRSLAMPATDAWGRDRHSAADDWTGYWRYRVDPPSAWRRSAPPPPARACRSAITTGGASPRPTRRRSRSYGRLAPTCADGDNTSHASATPSYQAGEPGADFDDLLAWLGRPLLIARLAQAERL